MKQNFLKGMMTMAAAVLLSSGAMAQTKVTPTVDGWVAVGGGKNYTGTIELKNQSYEKDEVAKQDLFYGVMHFSLPQAPEGKVLSKATLRLVTERCKNDRKTDIYLLGAEVTDGADYASLESAITAALAGTKLAEFDMVGQNGRAVELDDVTDPAIASWTNTIELPVASFKYASTLNLVIAAPVVRTSANDSNRFFASEQETVTNSKNGTTYQKDDLVPQLTLEYEDAPADGSDVLRPTVDGWVAVGGGKNYTGNIELKNQSYEKDEVAKQDLFYGVMRFDLAVPTGKEIESATLRLVTERCKNDRNTDLYLLDATIAADATYDDLSAAIATALAGTKLTSFEMVGQNGKAVEYDGVDNTDIAAWTNNISLPADQLKGKSVLNILISAPAVRTSANDSNRFFSSEQEDVTNNNTGVSYQKKDLVPQLLLVYKDAPIVDGIQSVRAAAKAEGIYNLSGQRLSRMQRGIVVIGGKKMLVK